MTTTKTTIQRGKPRNIYLKDEDIERLRALGGFLAGQGHRVSDSAVIAACLRVAKADTKLLKAFEAGLLLDGRLKREDQ